MRARRAKSDRQSQILAELDRAPHAGPDYQERAGALLSDPAEIDRIVAAVIEIVSPCAAPATPVAPAA